MFFPLKQWFVGRCFIWGRSGGLIFHLLLGCISKMHPSNHKANYLQWGTGLQHLRDRGFPTGLVVILSAYLSAAKLLCSPLGIVQQPQKTPDNHNTGLKSEKNTRESKRVKTSLPFHRFPVKTSPPFHRFPVKTSQNESKQVPHFTVFQSKRVSHFTVFQSKRVPHFTVFQSKRVRHFAVFQSQRVPHFTVFQRKKIREDGRS